MFFEAEKKNQRYLNEVEKMIFNSRIATNYEIIDYFYQGILGSFTANFTNTVIPVDPSYLQIQTFHKTDINLQNPLIIIPRHQRSHHFLAADLGTFRITNSIGHDHGRRHHLSLDLKGFTLSAGVTGISYVD